ncbi:hypothetical protein Cgig2_021254 [Carnegiea gigantea]|uniref:Uncharacterized protein n=1 Tax=Carnegiea gigantea TaxID=171969 RepID=A0A9Q1JYP6_9CARY|nr:hypothetical protein Cgig2_021254 [Carnegiea gigantea]
MNLFPNCTSIKQAAEYVRDHFRWSLRDPSAPGPMSLPSDCHGLCPHFDLEVATRYARDSNTSEMVQIIFYAMVIDDAAELGPSLWLGDNDVRLRRAQASHPADPPTNPMLAGGLSRGRATSFPSFRGTVQAAEYVRDNLRWSVRETSSLRPNLLPLHFTAYCLEFDHIVAMQFAHATHIPEMV